MSDDLNTILETIRLNRHDIPSEKNCSLAAICGLDTEGALIAARYNLEKNPSALSDRAKAVLSWKTGRDTDAALYDEWARAFCDYEEWRDSFRVRAENASYLNLLKILSDILEEDDFYCRVNLDIKSHDLSPFGVNHIPRVAILVGREGKLRLFERRDHEDILGRFDYIKMHHSICSELELISVVDSLSILIERGYIKPQWFDKV